jgi:hypothetical protein
MSRQPTIIDAINNPKLFGALPRFKKLQTWTAWLVELKAIFGLAMTADDVVVFQRHTGRVSPPTNGFKETFLIIGRRGVHDRRPTDR